MWKDRHRDSPAETNPFLFCTFSVYSENHFVDDKRPPGAAGAFRQGAGDSGSGGQTSSGIWPKMVRAPL